MDYGLISLSEHERVHIYGTPGQERFDFMWDILRKGSIGMILLIDNTRHSPLDDLVFFLEKFKDQILETRVAIGITKTGQLNAPSREAYYATIRSLEWFDQSPPPIFTVDARKRSDLMVLFQALLYSINPGVEDFEI